MRPWENVEHELDSNTGKQASVVANRPASPWLTNTPEYIKDEKMSYSAMRKTYLA